MRYFAVAAVLAVAAAVYPGYFKGSIYPYLLGINHYRKSAARTAPEPARLWALFDPPASLGSLSDIDIQSNRIVRRSLLQVSDRALDAEYAEEPQNALLEIDYDDETVQDAVLRSAETTEVPSTTEVEEEATEVPTTTEVFELETEAPETCGGDVVIGSEIGSGKVGDTIYNSFIMTPGFDEGEEYPEDLECQWNIQVDPTKCLIGGWGYSFQPGSYIRETTQCHKDYVSITSTGSYTRAAERYCGTLADEHYQVSDFMEWSPSNAPQSTILTLKSSTRQSGDGGPATGFNMTVTAYCVKYNLKLFKK